ncbi:hypothetical protein CDAR_609501 [Caerostris darwini]|uniref:Uncharacterized protein n=1 Tax=Caerostris darwini TaxID=1538125 RepID=A0AAV4SBU7_9ARAC|nr:hypothetical protein CDAR_609501 [Caerostris darwini]
MTFFLPKILFLKDKSKKKKKKFPITPPSCTSSKKADDVRGIPGCRHDDSVKLIDGALERIEGIIQRNKEDECVIPSPCLKQQQLLEKWGSGKKVGENFSSNRFFPSFLTETAEYVEKIPTKILLSSGAAGSLEG